MPRRIEGPESVTFVDADSQLHRPGGLFEFRAHDFCRHV